MKKRLKYVSLLSEFDKFIRASKSGRRRKPDGSRISLGTIESYKNCRKILVRFSLKYGDPEIYAGMTMTKRFYRERTRYWKHTLFQLMDFLRACRYCDTYIWNNQKILRAVMHYLHQQQGWPDAGLMAFRMPRVVQPDPVTLSVIQVQQLLGAKFGCSLKEHRLAIVRDIVITGCLTGLRYSDLIALKWENLVKCEGRTWLRLQSQKTGIITKLLLPNFLTTVIQRYRKLRRQNIFPRISNVNLNIQVKKLGKWMGWNELTQVIRSRGGVLKVERTGKFYELITTHTMRRTCISTMLQLGMPEHLVRQVSGHAPNSREFFRYVKIAQNWQDNETECVHKEILNGISNA